ncbi:MAG: VanZ family protein [Clostridia bacterium]|nr:VanZ family protein [Clostridia bacterium]
MNKRKVIQVILIVLIALNVAFIFSQSMLPPAKSTEVSDTVGDIVEEIIPPETSVGGFVQNNVRKLAHFFEFFTLGVLVATYVAVFLPKLKWVLHTLPVGFIVAVLDETIQIFSDRGPSVRDVWIDFSGFLCASIAFYLLYALTVLVIRKRNLKRGTNG